MVLNPGQGTQDGPDTSSDSGGAQSDAPLRISVAMAAYNAEAYVAAAVRSILNQVPPPLEVVVCDDASTDGTAGVLASFGQRIRVIRHDANRGEAAAKNTAVRAAHGDVVVILDADDEYQPGYLSAVAAALQTRPDLDVVTTDAYLVQGDRILGRWYRRGYPFAHGDQRTHILDRNFVFGRAAVRLERFRALGGFDETIRYATDWDLWVRLIHAGARIGLVPEPLVRYRLHEGNLSANQAAMLAGEMEVLETAIRRLRLTEGEAAVAHRGIASRRRALAREQLKVVLAERRPGARRAASAVVRDSGQSRRSRAVALVAWLVPSLPRAMELRRRRRSWLGPGGARLPRLATSARPRVLLTLADVAWPPDSGKRIRAGAIVAALSQVADVDVAIVFADAGRLDRSLPAGVTVNRCVIVDAPIRNPAAAALTVLLRRVPWQVAAQRWGVVRRALRAWSSTEYDLVWFGALDHAVSLAAPARRRITVVDADDVETAKLAGFLALPVRSVGQWFERLQRRVELPLWARVQRRVGAHADRVVVCSELDRRRFAGPRVDVVPNAYPDPGPPVPRPEGSAVVVLVANFRYEPNVDAARYAVTAILPRLRELVPEVRLRLVGRGGRERLARLSDLPGVELIGAVPDVAEELAGAHVSIAPIRYGGGTRIKILEAFAHGVPVVSTSLGCEGLLVTDGVHLRVADDAEAFAAACARLIGDPGHAADLARAGRELYDGHYRPEHAAEAVRRVVSAALDECGRRRAPGR